jgi:hypothetical protein
MSEELQDRTFQAPTPPSVNHLELVRERTKQPITEFLEQHHPLGGVPGWKACFSGRYKDSIVALVVVGRPVARAADDGTELSITRYSIRPDCENSEDDPEYDGPYNIGSWLIARARNWARLEGYDAISAHAGVAGNHGTVYEAAGFECVDVTMADGAGWLTQGEDRETWDDYERRKWVSEL